MKRGAEEEKEIGFVRPPEKRAMSVPDRYKQNIIDLEAAKKRIIQLEYDQRRLRSEIRSWISDQILSSVKQTLFANDPENKFAENIRALTSLTNSYTTFVLSNGWEIHDADRMLYLIVKHPKKGKISFEINPGDANNPTVTLFNDNVKGVNGLTSKVSKLGKFIVWMFRSTFYKGDVKASRYVYRLRDEFNREYR